MILFSQMGLPKVHMSRILKELSVINLSCDYWQLFFQGIKFHEWSTFMKSVKFTYLRKMSNTVNISLIVDCWIVSVWLLDEYVMTIMLYGKAVLYSLYCYRCIHYMLECRYILQCYHIDISSVQLNHIPTNKHIMSSLMNYKYLY